MTGLSHRQRQPEWMDDPTIPDDLHASALHALARINRLSRTAASLWRTLQPLVQRQQVPGKPFRVLDLACGAGDVTLALHERFQRTAYPFQISACDISRFALQCAQQRAEAAHAQIDYFVCDVLREPLPGGYDAVVCNLFLHHLDTGPARDVLAAMGQAARHLIVNDLVRSRRAWLWTWLGTRLLTRSPVVHVDGPRSVEGAFTMHEMRDLAHQAGLAEVAVRPLWPQRMLLTARGAEARHAID